MHPKEIREHCYPCGNRILKAVEGAPLPTDWCNAAHQECSKIKICDPSTRTLKIKKWLTRKDAIDTFLPVSREIHFCQSCGMNTNGECPVDKMAGLISDRNRQTYQSCRRKATRITGCQVWISSLTDPRTTRDKIRAVMSDEWMPTVDIAQWAGLSTRTVRNSLQRMKGSGMVEYMWDGLLGKAYWKLPEEKNR